MTTVVAVQGEDLILTPAQAAAIRMLVATGPCHRFAVHPATRARLEGQGLVEVRGETSWVYLTAKGTAVAVELERGKAPP